MEKDRLRTLVASLVFAGDFQELMHLYGLEDVSLAPQDLGSVYDPGRLQGAERAAFEEIKSAIPDDLLPRSDHPVAAPAEMIELTGRCAAEQGKLVPAVRAFRGVDALAKYHELYADFAMESLASGSYEQAAFELTLAGRLGWNCASQEERRAFLVGLGIDASELASALGAERSKGRLSGGRALPDFPALQTYGPLLHAMCGSTGCVARRSVAETTPLAIRLLIHDDPVAQRALQAAGDQAPRLLQCLAREADPELDEYAQGYERAWERFHALEVETQEPEEADSPAEDDTDADEGPAAGERDKEPDRSEVLRVGLEESWRNCLAELAVRHPLSLFTVCTVRAGSLGTYVVPVGEPGTMLLTAVRG